MKQADFLGLGQALNLGLKPFSRPDNNQIKVF
jgi:hypothetical protein